jgi:hypothetical protein
MATRSGGVSGVVISLVTFVFLFVIVLVLAVLFYTQRNKATQQAEAAAEELRVLIRANEEANEDFLAAKERAGGSSVVSQLLAEIDQYKNYLIGNPEAAKEQVRNRLVDAGILDRVGQGDDATYPLNAAATARIQAAEAAVASAQQTIEDLRGGEQTRQAEVRRLEQELQRTRTDTAATIAELEGQLARRTEQFEAYEADAEAERQDLIARYEQFKQDAQAREDELLAEIEDQKQEIARLNARIDALVRVVRANQLSGPDMTLEPDGRIIATNPTENSVTINLGRQDNLILGMTFAVFDERSGIVTEVERDGRTVHVGEKAIIEVTRFGDDGRTAIARVIRQARGQTVSSDDLISNIVYDKDRVFEFFVYGDFDLNNDNRATVTERDRVRNMIRTWGGEVIQAQEPPVDTDFVVLGEAPEFPQQPGPAEPESVWEEYQQAVQEYRQYNEIVGLARELGIPILNQNRFLTLVGYYDN